MATGKSNKMGGFEKYPQKQVLNLWKMLDLVVSADFLLTCILNLGGNHECDDLDTPKSLTGPYIYMFDSEERSR